jgi:putative tricarboxylic transport membrane protein
MEVLLNLLHGLANIAAPVNLAAMVIGLVLGMLVAVLPGLTLVMGVVLALPFTYKMGVEPALILLTAMYVSGTYGGAITAILFRIPGEPMDVPLLWDGYAMTRRGDAALALGYSLVAALVGGLASAVVMVALSKPVASIALSFSSPEFFAVTAFGLVSVVTLSGGSLVNALISLCVGLLIATVGVDAMYGAERFAFGLPFLQDGIEFLLVMVGAYGIGEVLSRLQLGFAAEATADATRGHDSGRRSRSSRTAGDQGRSCVALRRGSWWESCPEPARRCPPSLPTASRANTARTPVSWAAAHRRASSLPNPRPPRPSAVRWCRC